MKQDGLINIEFKVLCLNYSSTEKSKKIIDSK
jgi:hypothetical protein